MNFLFLEEDAPVEARLEAILVEAGHSVHRTAIKNARAKVASVRPEVVVLAGLSPEMLACCRSLRRSVLGEDVLVIALTDGEAPIDAALTAGLDDCLTPDRDESHLRVYLALVERRAERRQQRHTIERELAARIAQQQAVAELGQRVSAGEDLQMLLDHASEATARALGVPLCGIFARRGNGDELHLAAGSGWKEMDQEVTLPMGEASQVGYTLLVGEPILVVDAAEEDRFGLHPMLAGEAVVSGLAVPVPGESEPAAVLAAFDRVPRAFSREDQHFMQAVANLLAGAREQQRVAGALRESEARARAILETIVDGIITINAYGRIASFNSSAERIFGYRAAEVIGRNVSILMPTPYHEEHDGYLQSYRHTGRRKIIGIGREVMGRRKDGSTFPLELAVSEIEVSGRTLFTGIVRDITDRRDLEHEILRSTEQERRRIGQDLHDGLGQMLTGIGLISRNLARRLQEDGNPYAEEVVEITELIKEADQYARGLARGLVPVDLEASGLAAALQRLAQSAERLFGIRCTFEEVGNVLIHDNIAATHLFRIAQESVSNAVKHGRARFVKISLAGGNGQTRLRVHDDGVGFSDDSHDENRGMGVRIMHYRARIIGATLEITDGLSGGTTITCTLQRSDTPARVAGPASEAPS